jgi:general secretion pathway protein G
VCNILEENGFTLMEIIIAVAIVAIMAGTLAPVAFKQINSARSRAAIKELELLEEGLLSFYEDTGRFPTEEEGLAALVTDPGAINWRGPYVTTAKRNPVEAVSEDPFGQNYIYDFNPATVPPGAYHRLRRFEPELGLKPGHG